MRGVWISLVLAFALGWGWPGAAQAETRVEVIATDPPGPKVRLGLDEKFYIRIAHDTTEPIRIYVEPCRQGKVVYSWTSASFRYDGKGEVIGWFSLRKPGAVVDEVRILIRPGYDRQAEPRVIARYPVNVLGTSQPAADRTYPAWVIELTQQYDRLMRASQTRRSQKTKAPPRSNRPRSADTTPPK